MKTLYLLPAEEKLMSALPADISAGWTVEKEGAVTMETADELNLRYRIANFTDPNAKALAESMKHAVSPTEIEKLLQTFDMQKLPQDQLAELFFTLGTKVTGWMVLYVLSNAKDQEDMEGVAGLTLIRHMLIEANIPA